VELEITTPIYERLDMVSTSWSHQERVISGLVMQCKKIAGAQTRDEADKIQVKIDVLIDQALSMSGVAQIIKAMKKLVMAARIEGDIPTIDNETDRREYSTRLLTALEIKCKR